MNEEIPDIPNVEKEVKQVKKRGRPKKEKKQVSNKSLDLQFVPDSGDASPPKIEQFKQESENKALMEIDYKTTARGFLQMIDMIMSFMSMVSKGALEYEKLTEREFEAGANALMMEKKVLELIASQSWAVHAIVMMQLVGVFAPRIKIRKKKKEEKEKIVEKIQSVKEMNKDIQKVKLTESQVKTLEETVKNDNDIFLDDMQNVTQSTDIENIDNSSGELQLSDVLEVRPKNYGEPVEGKGTKLVKKL